MLDRLARALGPTEQDSVGALRITKRQLIKSDALTTRLHNARAGGFGEAKSADGELRDIKKTHIVGNSSNDDSDLALLTFHETNQFREGKRRVIDVGHAKSPLHHRRELGVRPTREKLVELHKQLEVHIVR
jgi:hypothetical protein